MCEPVRKDLLRRVAAALPEYLADVVRAANLDAVVAMACRQLQYAELACPAFCEKVAALPTDPEAREARLNAWRDELCRGVAEAGYVLDCERVARFLAPETSDAERLQIAGQFRLEYAAFAYGPMQGGQSDEPRGCLGARLIKACGEREARVAFAQAQQMLDEKVFSLEGFGRCARQYDPRQGMKFENFFRQWIRWRAGDVVRDVLRRGRPFVAHEGGDGPGIEAVEGGAEGPSEEERPTDLAAALRQYLERYCRGHGDPAQAELEVAAFELRRMAYLDPDGMTPSTRRLVGPQLARLKEEFHSCQERLRQLEDVDRTAAQSNCHEAGRLLDRARARLEREGCSAGVEELEREATARNKTDMEADWGRLGYRDREGRAGLRLGYQIAWKALALAKGKRERVKLEKAKWAACRKPWVRSQGEIGKLLGVSQAAVSRYLKAIEAVVGRICNPP